MSRRVTRRSQSVVPFGVGSIVEFEDEALMQAGLEAWPPQAEQITDDRLARRLGINHFRMPPPRPDPKGALGTTAPLPYVRFPQWHFCPRCRWLKKVDLYAVKRPQCDNTEPSPLLRGRPPCGMLLEKRRSRMLPLRFVAACAAGHIEDFPWNAWAHTKPGTDLTRDRGCTPEALYFYATNTGGLSGLRVTCSKCDAKRSLMGVTSKGGLKGFACAGAMPWLGKDASEACSISPNGRGSPEMMTIQRGASNLYFPEVASSILIPPFSSRVHRVIREFTVRDILTSSRVDGKISEDTFRTIARMRNIDVDQLKAAFHSLESSAVEAEAFDPDETSFRNAEFRALQQERREKDDLLACRPQAMDSYAPIVREYFDRVTLVERLAETRVLTGFHRLTPGSAPPSRLSRGRVNWLPAFRVHGEGIFLAVNEERLMTQARRSNPRLDRLLKRAVESRPCPLILSVELILLHTLAHVLIKRLSYEAGYGASSIRERIYSAPNGHPHKMSGILLYTAAGDADGTLGGLVGLGRPRTLERVIAGALEEARWCAADPICAESSGQGPESLNLAACHACALLPETSCELQNRLLDRVIVRQFFGQEAGTTTGS
jgi:hypothetical protein